MGPLIPAILAFFLAVPAFSAQLPFPVRPGEELDPYAAQAYLKDVNAQHANQAADPDAAAEMMERATALKDFSDILTAYVEPASMNEAFRLRLGDDDANPNAPKLLGFGAHTANLLAWRAKYFAFVPADRVEAALWEWKSLTPEQKNWLSASPRSLTEEKWTAAAFSRRFVSLHEWATAIYDKMMKTSPKNRVELGEMINARYRTWSVLDGTQKRASGEYMTKASAAVEGLERLEHLPASVRESTDPAMKDLLAKARAGATPQETLAALGKLFDKAGVHDDDVQTQAPDRPDQKLSSLDPKLFGQMLGTGLRAEIRDVDAGRKVDEFFATHPLSIKVRDLATNLAQFESGTGDLVFNERFLTDWIKSQGLSAQAVVSDPAKFHELVMILAPVFVHESTHQMQKAFADDHGVHAWNAQHQEIEAKEVQSDYVLEKEAKDPAYRKFLADARPHSIYVQQDLAQAEAFRRNPRGFHASVMSDYYAGLPSLEAMESSNLLFLNTNLAALRDEQKRRAGMRFAERAKIDSLGKDKDADFATMAEWKAYLTGVKSTTLDQLIAAKVAERAKTIKTYELTSARQAQVLEHIESDAEAVIRGDAPPAPHEVPPPGKPR